jgi:hypothetical protein
LTPPPRDEISNLHQSKFAGAPSRFPPSWRAISPEQKTPIPPGTLETRFGATSNDFYVGYASVNTVHKFSEAHSGLLDATQTSNSDNQKLLPVIHFAANDIFDDNNKILSLQVRFCASSSQETTH